jgi:fructosamine-3-kinase
MQHLCSELPEHLGEIKEAKNKLSGKGTGNWNVSMNPMHLFVIFSMREMMPNFQAENYLQFKRHNWAGAIVCCT